MYVIALKHTYRIPPSWSFFRHDTFRHNLILLVHSFVLIDAKKPTESTRINPRPVSFFRFFIYECNYFVFFTTGFGSNATLMDAKFCALQYSTVCHYDILEQHSEVRRIHSNICQNCSKLSLDRFIDISFPLITSVIHPGIADILS